MAYAFAYNGNESLPKPANPTQELRDEEWFKRQLTERGVGKLEIIWGDYRAYFHEIPPHVMDRYLHHRPMLFHKQALELTLLEEKAMEDHPFAQ